MFKINKQYLVVLLVSALALIAFRPWGDIDRDKVLMNTVLGSLKKNHYEPAVIDDAFSERVFEMYLNRLDFNKRMFLASDVEQLEKYRLELDDEALAGEFDFFDEAIQIRNQRFEQITSYYQEILAAPFDFTIDETVEMDGEKLEYAKDEDELRARWHQYLKYQVLARIHTKLEQQEKAEENGEEDVEIKTFEELEAEARDRVLKNMDNWAKNMAQEDRDDFLAGYIQAFANAHEPHTSYFPPLEKENFDIRMSGKLEGIGAQLRQEDGYIKVVNIVPGSASWRQGELEVNDKIIKVAQAKEEPVDVVDMKMDDVLPMIRGKKGTEVRLTVKKVDGTIKVIPIIRDVVVLEESYAKSAIIEHKKTKAKVGLIDLRSFYADFQDRNGRRCSRDVRQEVQKLIAEDVDGIVIDLRFNGGGSLGDVVDMTGLFIPEGPVVQVKTPAGSPLVLRDTDRGKVLYDGPLVIMVNSFSASASEIMAAALQDYGRAIIVGTAPTTFGKGTVQRFFSLDDELPRHLKENTDLGELGALKITIQKFYRVNGGSTQLKGVTPDIILPGIYSQVDVGEKEEEFPMEWTEIDAAEFRVDGAISQKGLERIKKKSERRVADNPTFMLLEENAGWLRTQRDETTYSLNLETYQDERAEEKATSKRFEEGVKPIDFLDISSLAADAAAIEGDTVRQASVESWHKNLKKDVYLEEVMYIIDDWN